MARGLARDIEAEQRSLWTGAPRDSKDEDVLKHSTIHERRGKNIATRAARNPFSDIGNAVTTGTATSTRERRGTPRAPKVHMPDVTGLTSAVASPAKNGLEHYEYQPGEGPREAEGIYFPSANIMAVADEQK